MKLHAMFESQRAMYKGHAMNHVTRQRQLVQREIQLHETTTLQAELHYVTNSQGEQFTL